MKTREELNLLIATEEDSNKVIVELASHIETLAEDNKRLLTALTNLLEIAEQCVTDNEVIDAARAAIDPDYRAPRPNDESVPDEYWAGGFADNH